MRRDADIAQMYDAILSAEGLDPVDIDGVMKYGHDNEQREHPVGDKTLAVRAYLTWARQILEEFPFRTPRAKKIWSMMCESTPRREIAKKLKISVASVRRAIHYVYEHSPPPPVRNPWKRGGDERKLNVTADSRRLIPKEPYAGDDPMVLFFCEYPERGAHMLNTAISYIDDLGEDHMHNYRVLVGAEQEDDSQLHDEEEERRKPDPVRLPADYEDFIPSPVRSLSKEEIELLKKEGKLVPPKQIRKVPQ